MNKKKLYWSIGVIAVALVSTALVIYKNIKKSVPTKSRSSEEAISTKIKLATPDFIEHSKLSRREIAEEILFASPAFIAETKGLDERIKKNGGIGFSVLLEGSPDSADHAYNLSSTYDFQIAENYSDRMTVMERYTFDFSKKKLYQYDFSIEKLIPIPFDAKILEKEIKFN